ncbi:uncharacterized protein [Watersipora subatra]|uniref:uncharacterized protein n=1 Tax=Watersipora subatra TaxID=2589382 RepID=UPI00355C9B17
MIDLPETHPWVHTRLNHAGQFTVQRSAKIPFTSLAADHAIEQTVNRQSKTSGGVRGITLTRGAVQRWVLAQPAKAAVLEKCEMMAGIKDPEDYKAKDTGLARMKSDEKHIERLSETISSMINPWNSGLDSLVSISSGAVAAQPIQQSLDQAYCDGEKALTEFIEERVVKKTTDVFAPIKQQKLKTFGTTTKSTSSSKDEVKSGRSLFGRMLVVANQRKIDLKNLLTYSLSSVSLPLANAEGSGLNKTTKADLLKELETDCDSQTADIDSLYNTALIIDAMALIQALPRSQIPTTFGELSTKVLHVINSYSKMYKAKRVDFVGDNYPRVSIKGFERSRRTHGRLQITHIYKADQNIPKQWSKFLAVGQNKEALLEFLVQSWKSANLKEDLELYATSGATCVRYVFTNNDASPPVSEVPELHSDHEEADTRLLLHATHARAYGTVLIKSPDTDVAILCLSHFPKMNCERLIFATGVGSKLRLLDIGIMHIKLGSDLCAALPQIHALTGCDSTSALFGKGKKKCYSIFKNNPPYVEAIKTSVGQSFYTNKETMTNAIEPVICMLYSPQAKTIEEARYRAFCCNASSERQLPPTRDALQQHLLRVNYQATIWQLSLSAKIKPPSPHGFGWILQDEKLDIKWMENPTAPPSLLQTVYCSCKKSACHSGKCSCRNSQLKCTDLCKCDGCSNSDQDLDNAQHVSSDFEEDLDNFDG